MNESTSERIKPRNIEVARYRFFATSTGFNYQGTWVIGPVMVDTVIYDHGDTYRSTYSLEINGRHQTGGFADHLPSLGVVPVTFLINVEPNEARDSAKRLWGYSEEMDTPVQALLFGELVKLATPIMERYQSDLFHDARWIAEHITQEGTFYFGVDSDGTAIGQDRACVARMRRRLFRVKLHNRKGEWYVSLDEEVFNTNYPRR